MHSLTKRFWYQPRYSFVTVLLLPFSWLFRGIVALRYCLYKNKYLKTIQFSVPVIIVGNISVGGTGKTPLVIALAHFLKEQGLHPGIVSRGVGGKRQRLPLFITKESEPDQVGDEALLLHKRSLCPVMIGIDRPQAVKALLDRTQCDIVLCDDGLQHYRLARDIEIAVVDEVRQFGNCCLLPAGPLREPISRLKRVDFVISQGEHLSETTMTLQPEAVFSLKNKYDERSLKDFQQKPVHAFAAIGHPDRFYKLLRYHGLQIIEHAYPDHYLFVEKDFKLNDNFLILMTEKDAVKCSRFADERFFYLSVSALLHDQFKEALFNQLQKIKGITQCVA